MTDINLAEILSRKPDYSNLQIKKQTLTVELTSDELAEILKVYDWGIEKSELLYLVIAKLKNQINP